MHIELAVDVGHVGLGGAAGQAQLLLDIGGVAAAGQQEQHVEFAGGQLAARGHSLA